MQAREPGVLAIGYILGTPVYAFRHASLCVSNSSAARPDLQDPVQLESSVRDEVKVHSHTWQHRTNRYI